MTAIVFAGPSLAGADLSLPEDFVLAPPARQGDVYRAARSRPTAIGVVDGYFEGVPSVWHKEILWALSNGIAVYGSASIGALRAAEMQAFDIILLDVMLPFMDGLAMTRRLRRQNIQTPILLLTARDAPEEIVRGLDSGADDYLTKPFSFDVLSRHLRTILDATRAA